MKKSTTILYSLILVASIIGSIEALASKPQKRRISTFKNACTNSESWSFSRNIPQEWRDEFRSTYRSKSKSVQGFSEGMALRKANINRESRILAEYWVSRSLYNAGLIHIAHKGFSVIASRPMTRSTLGPQMAAIDCIVRINRQFPTLTVSGKIYQNLLISDEIREEPKFLPVLWAAHGVFVREQIAKGKSSRQIKRTLKELKGSGAHEALAQGLFAASRKKHHNTIKWLEKFLAAKSFSDLHTQLINPSRLLLGRAYYSVGGYPAAAKQLQLVEKNSNELTMSLSELAWAFLMDRKYGESIGTTINLQSGGLRKTFSPEAPMVMAMALNELCQYPESIKAIDIFRSNYKSTFNWLEKWHTIRNKPEGIDLYGQALSFLKGTKGPGGVPDRIASEWLRSPLFIAQQDEINLVFKEKKQSVKLGKRGSRIQEEMAADIVEFLKDFTEKFAKAKKNMKPTDDYPSYIKNGLEKLRDKIVHYKRVRKAAPYWRSVLKSHRAKTASIIKNSVHHINRDLRELNIRMLHQIQEVAENNYFIEVEIYNGASQDIIWQNAHPEYAKIAKNLKDEKEQKKEGQTLNWGVVSHGLAGTGEIWEDELGSFKADVYDNCSNKEKYLNLKRARLVNNSN